jgi:hypothetical protein
MWYTAPESASYCTHAGLELQPVTSIDQLPYHIMATGRVRGLRLYLAFTIKYYISAGLIDFVSYLSIVTWALALVLDTRSYAC